MAVYGALVSTFAVVWNVLRDRRDSARIKLTAMLGYAIPSKTGTQLISHKFFIQKWPEKVGDFNLGLFLTITNVGRRPVIVEGWAIGTDRKKTGNDNFIYQLTVLPKKLDEAQYAVEHTDDLSLIADGAKRIYVWDTAGRQWSLLGRELRRLRKEVRGLRIETQ